VADKEIGFPLFEETAPLLRIYTWDAYNREEGPAVEEIRANNTCRTLAIGKALLYKSGEYVSTISMPYTASAPTPPSWLAPLLT